MMADVTRASWLGAMVSGACLTLNAMTWTGVTEVKADPEGAPGARIARAGIVALPFDPRDYLADLKAHLARYHRDISDEIATGDVKNYYFTSYYLHGMAGAAEATGDLEVMDELLGFSEALMAQARPLVRNGRSYPEWGPWDEKGNPQQLYAFQAAGALARTAAIIALRPEFKARYGVQGARIAAFVDRSTFRFWFDKKDGVYQDPKSAFPGGQIPWLPEALGGWGSYPLWNDKCSHLGMIATWMYQATRNPVYRDVAIRVAKGFRAHVTAQDGTWIWDKGAIGAGPEADRANRSPDTSHANREAMMVVGMYEAGIVFTLADVKAIGATLTRVIWNRSEAEPMFTNYIDGDNGRFKETGPWQNGNIYHGWAMVGRYSPEAQRVLAISYNAIQTRSTLNPSLAMNASGYGRIQLSGTLLRNLMQ